MRWSRRRPADPEAGSTLGGICRLAIGIPTRNRANLAMTAIESVLAARADVALVVSDNSTDREERERLREFCEQTDGAAEYIRPPEPLAMPAHWEFLRTAIAATDATHVTYLTDRLVFAERALPQLLEIMSSHPRHVVSYQLDHVNDVATPVELVQPQWTGRLLELESAKLVELSSRGVFGRYLPRLMNCVVPAEVIAAIADRFGDVFGTISPDYRFAYRCLAVRETILYFDRACLLEHGVSRSNGGNVIRGTTSADAEDFARDISTLGLAATPAPELWTVSNAIFQEYFSVRGEVGMDGFPFPRWPDYLGANAVSVDRMVEPETRASTAALLRRRGWTRGLSARRVATLAAQMAGYFVSHPGALARSMKRQLWDRPPGTPAARLLAKAGLNPRTRDDLRFASAAQAIAYANEHPRPRMPYAWHVHQLERTGAIRAEATLRPTTTWT